MSTNTDTSLDLGAFARAFETWDVEGLLGMYTDDIELTQVDHTNPPSSAQVTHGKDVLRGMFEFAATNGVKATVENTVSGPDRAAATITCALPDGRKIAANVILDVVDGRIARQLEYQAADPRPSGSESEG